MPELESDKAVALSDENGFPIYSGWGTAKIKEESGFEQIQSHALNVAEKDHAAHGVAQCEELSGHAVPPHRQDHSEVPGSYYAHHAEVKDRVRQFKQDWNGMTAVSKPMCPHCRLWHQRVAKRQNKTLLVADPIYIRRFNADGSVDVFYNSGFPDPAALGKRAAKVRPGTPPSKDKYYDGSAWYRLLEPWQSRS